MSAFMAAFKALMACLTMLRNGLCGASFLNRKSKLMQTYIPRFLNSEEIEG